MSASPTQSEQTPRHPNIWDRVLTSTPIVMTVLATVLAGLSSSEMTLAQYHRALAAQNQSKAGDQWSLFQAKRIRGSNLEMTIDLLQSEADPEGIGAAELQTAVDQLPQELHRAVKQAKKLIEAIAAAKGELGESGKALQQAAIKLRDLATDRAKAAETARDQIKQELARDEVQEAVTSLRTHKLPRVEFRPLTHPQMVEAIQAVHDRRPESETANLMGQISEETIRQAIQDAEANIQAAEIAYKPISDTSTRLDKLLREQSSLARACQRAVSRIDELSSVGPPLSDLVNLRAPIDVIGGGDEGTEQLLMNFKAAHYAYMAQRYRQEADLNEQAAVIYEVQVRKSSLTAEVHRQRSKNFFFGMLAAQAGVTIATFSLAVKHRSALFWSLAILSGLVALIIALYVYFYIT